MKITFSKCTLFLFLLLSGPSVFSQNKALDYFNLAVKNYNAQNFRQADSLFSLSVKLDPSAETFYNRALCRGKMANKNGYCLDLAKATELGEQKAIKLFCRSCGKIDTTYKKIDITNKSTKLFYKTVSCRYGDSIIYSITTKYWPNNPATTRRDTNLYRSSSNPEVFTIVESQPEFPGGIPALMKFVKNNISTPDVLIKNELVGKVYLRFIVNEDGSVTSIEVMKGIEGCSECDEEAMRVLSMMPLWKPAIMQGRPVKSYFNIPIRFQSTRN